MSDTTDMTIANDESLDDLASLLQRRQHAKPTRLTYVLLTVLVLTTGFVGGAFAQRTFGSSSSGSSTSFPAMAGAMPSGVMPSGAAAAGGMGATPAGMTIGTVKLVDGQTLYVTDMSGSTVTVSVPQSATVTAQSDVPLADLGAGTSVIIQGETGTDGTVTATSVSQGSLPGAVANQGASR